MNNNIPVIFRRWPDGSIIALFPSIPSDQSGIFCDSYERLGGHSGAAYEGVISRTTPASPKEYDALRRELESEPYNYQLKVYQRRTSEHLDAYLARLPQRNQTK